jgi:hypothetical protein
VIILSILLNKVFTIFYGYIGDGDRTHTSINMLGIKDINIFAGISNFKIPYIKAVLYL